MLDQLIREDFIPTPGTETNPKLSELLEGKEDNYNDLAEDERTRLLLESRTEEAQQALRMVLSNTPAEGVNFKEFLGSIPDNSLCVLSLTSKEERTILDFVDAAEHDDISLLIQKLAHGQMLNEFFGTILLTYSRKFPHSKSFFIKNQTDALLRKLSQQSPESKKLRESSWSDQYDLLKECIHKLSFTEIIALWAFEKFDKTCQYQLLTRLPDKISEINFLILWQYSCSSKTQDRLLEKLPRNMSSQYIITLITHINYSGRIDLAYSSLETLLDRLPSPLKPNEVHDVEQTPLEALGRIIEKLPEELLPKDILIFWDRNQGYRRRSICELSYKNADKLIGKLANNLSPRDILILWGDGTQSHDSFFNSDLIREKLKKDLSPKEIQPLWEASDSYSQERLVNALRTLSPQEVTELSNRAAHEISECKGIIYSHLLGKLPNAIEFSKLMFYWNQAESAYHQLWVLEKFSEPIIPLATVEKMRNSAKSAKVKKAIQKRENTGWNRIKHFLPLPI